MITFLQLSTGYNYTFKDDIDFIFNMNGGEE